MKIITFNSKLKHRQSMVKSDINALRELS